MRIYLKDRTPCIAKRNSFINIPKTNIIIPVIVIFEILTNSFINIYAIMSKLKKANSTKCKYAMTIGLKPNASWLIDGMVDPS